MRKASAKLIALFLITCTAFSAAPAQENTPADLTVQSTIPRAAAYMAFGFDALWTMSDGQMVRINAADNSFIEIVVPTSENAGLLGELDKYRGIAVGEGAVWVPDMASSTIYKVDPEQNKMVMTIATDIFGSKGSIGVGEGSVWVLTFDNRDKTLTRYNADTGAVEARIDLPQAGSGVLVAQGSVWVTAARRGKLFRIDPNTNQVAATIDIHGASHLLAAGDGSIWIPFETEGLIQRIDGRTGQVMATIQTGAADMEKDGDIAIGGGFIWIINRGSIVAQIDPRTNSAKGTFRPPTGTSTGRRIRHGGGSLWLSGSAIFRVAPPN